MFARGIRREKNMYCFGFLKKKENVDDLVTISLFQADINYFRGQFCITIKLRNCHHYCYVTILLSLILKREASVFITLNSLSSPRYFNVVQLKNFIYNWIQYFNLGD